jgi:hypothetical protein
VNATSPEGITLSYFAGLTTGEKFAPSETAVLGVSADGLVGAAFQDYISRIRAAKVRPVLTFKTFLDLQHETVTARNSIDHFQVLKQKLLDPYKLHLDSFLVDDGWDDLNSVWQIDREKFPGGFTDLSRTL